MTHHEENHEQEHEESSDPLLKEQEGKGYGEDEGERDEALEQSNWERL